jgi:hypothetical protein
MRRMAGFAERLVELARGSRASCLSVVANSQRAFPDSPALDLILGDLALIRASRTQTFRFADDPQEVRIRFCAALERCAYLSPRFH